MIRTRALGNAFMQYLIGTGSFSSRNEPGSEVKERSPYQALPRDSGSGMEKTRQEELCEFNDLSEDSDGEGSARCSEAQTGRRQRRWLPIALDALFGAEHNDEEPDDGEQDGSGDDFEG
ncbi:hypothetical protein C8R45DRAFT_944795 [Mycena sanguinolenta]|nr:hypothetical protein C8R45DRAFT_944795 [Mycena sanguinolenta]